MGWIKMYYFRGLIDSINFAYNFKTHFPARQYIFNPTFYNFLCKWSEVSDIPFYRFLHTKKRCLILGRVSVLFLQMVAMRAEK